MNNQKLVEKLLKLVGEEFPDLSAESLMHASESLYTAGHLCHSAGVVRSGLQITYQDVCRDASYTAARASMVEVQDALAVVLSIIGVEVVKVPSPSLRGSGWPNFVKKKKVLPLHDGGEYLRTVEDIIPYFKEIDTDYFECKENDFLNPIQFHCKIQGRLYEVNVEAEIGLNKHDQGPDSYYIADIEKIRYREICEVEGEAEEIEGEDGLWKEGN